jgi:fibronectin-binding autotransporter adhesin
MLFAAQFAAPALALDRTWIGGNVDWVDAGSSTNWNPNDEPDSDDRAIFNTANTVNLGSNNAVNGLALSGGIDLFTNDFDLTVDGLAEIAGAGSNLFVGGAGSELNADNVTVNASGTLELRGGSLTLDDEVGVGILDINAGGTVQGNGTITLTDSPGGATALLVNDGTLTAMSRGLTILSPPPVGTLTIIDTTPNPRIDLDGTGEAGVVNINRNQTLIIQNMPFADNFNGTMNLFHEATFQSSNGWTLAAGGSIVANNGFVDNPNPNPDIAAGTSTIAGALVTMVGGTINVVDIDGTLQFDANLTMSGGTFTNNGTAIFNGTTNITTAAGYAPAVSSADTIINGSMSITDAAGDFNWDGPGIATTTINGTGSLSLTVDQVDSGNDTYGGVLNLNDNADLAVNNTANSWTLANVLNKNNAGTSVVSGDRVVITGNVNANAGTLDMPAVTTTGSATLAVASTLSLGGATEFGGATSIAGAGTLLMEGTSTVTANTTIGVATFDWDGLGTGTGHTINDGVTFTINSTTIDTDGDMDDPINLGGNGTQLIVNGASPWTATAAINANNAGAGTATIGGSRRLILLGANADLNVNGNTNIISPLTFGASSAASIDAGFTLDATNTVTYDGGSISGLGTYSPGTSNLVTANTSITSSIFDFDNGSWTVDPGETLTVNVTDYDTTATNAFDGTITLNDGEISVTTGDAEFVMDGVLNMVSNNVDIAFAEWNGEPLDIGNDSGALDADVNVSGTIFSRISAPVDFNSDADVNIDGVTLVLDSTVNFDTVNGANNAEFTGNGRISFHGLVNVNEAVTFNMVSGEVDLDGGDLVGDFVNVDAPMTINAATMASFGRVNSGGGINTLDINNSVGTGVLTVNLDNAADEWTLNAEGVMNLVNDNTEATLLAGNDLNINGTVNVTGDVRVTARVDINGTVNINTAGQPLRLSGGDGLDENTINGATINGPGLFGADTEKVLYGFGTINADIDFQGTSIIRADNGTLTIAGTILQASTIGTEDGDGILNVVNAWNSNVASFVNLAGGELKGGTITVNNTSGISGIGLVSARVINNTRLLSNGGGTLLFETAANDNDWDGTGDTGQLRAGVGMTLELRDVGAAFGFGGTVSAVADGTVFANGFALDFNPGSTLSLLDGARYRSTSSTDIGGTVIIGAGAASTIEVTDNFFLTFETGSSTTLNGNLTLENNNINIEAGAVFNNGGGALIIPDGSNVVADNLADIDVLLDMQGGFRPGNSEGIGRVDLFDYQQGNTGELFVEIKGTALNAFDRLVASGDVVLDGYLNIDIDEISPMVPFVPVLGQTFNIITANTVTGTFDYADVSGMPAGLAFHIEYLVNAVQLQVVTKPFFSADFDDDGDVDATDLAIWQGAYNLNQLGDADGDNDSDGRDFLLWQRQFGGAPLVAVSTAVPEPSCSILLMLALSAVTAFRFHK